MATIPRQYQNLGPVSETDSGIVYKCYDLSNGFSVALRVFCSTDDDIKQLAEYQYDFLRVVDHPHIIRILDRGYTAEGFPFIVTEWAQDGNLSGKSNTLDLIDKQRVAIQIAEALDFLHSLGYLHGDIKPSNVLLFRDNKGGVKIKLSDFEFLRSGGYVSPTSWQGTVPYMSPEVLRGEPVGYSSDLYSLGVLMFELLTGRMPFQQENIYKLAYAQLDQEPELNEHEKSSLPLPLISSVFTLLQKNPTERIESAWKVRDALLGDTDKIKHADIRLGHFLVDYLYLSKLNRKFQTQELQSMLSDTFKGIESEEKLSKFLLDKSGTNPEIIRQYLRELVSSGLIARTNGCWKVHGDLESFTLSQDFAVQYLPSDRSFLNPDTQKVLEAVSIFKYPVRLLILEEVVDLEPSLLAAILHKFSQLGWLVYGNEFQAGRIRFSKGIDRDFILKGCDRESLYEMRRRAIQVLQGRLLRENREDILKELLYQAEEAAESSLIFRYALLLSERTQTKKPNSESLYYSLQALRHAGEGSEERTTLLRRIADFYDEKGQPKEASEYYSQYLSFEPADSKEIADAERKLGWCYARLADFELAEKYLTSSFQRFKSQGNQHAQAWVLLNLAATKHMERNYPECEAILGECDELVRGWQDSEEQARLYNLTGILEWSKGNYQIAYESYQRSFEKYEKMGKDKELGRVANNLGLLLRDWGRADDSLVYIQRDMEIARNSGDLMNLSCSYNNLAIVYWSLKRFDEGIHFARLAQELARQLLYREVEAMAHNNLGFLYLAKGSLDQALFHLRQAISVFKEINNPSGLGLPYYNQGEIYRVRQLPQLAAEFYFLSLDIRRRLGENAGVADSLAGLSRLYLEMSNFEQDNEYLPEAFSLYTQLGKQQEVVMLTLSHIEALCRAKRTDEAVSLLEQLPKNVGVSQSSTLGFHTYLAQGLIELNLGDYGEAEKHILKAFKGFRAEQDKVAQARASSYLGDLYSCLGRQRLATKFWRESLGLYRDLKVRAKIDQLESMMSEADRTARRDREQIQTLSKVSQLLAQIEDEEELLTQVLKLAIELLGAERGAIILYDKSKAAFEVRVSHGLEQETAKDAVEISRRTVREVQQTGKTFISGDAPSEALLKDHPSIRTHNILSILCAPLSVNQDVIGTIYLDSRTLTRAFTEDDRDFIDVLSSLLAVAISKAQRYSRAYEEIYELRQRAKTTYDFPNIIGKSPLMQEVFSMATKVAPTKATVLIQGESGTGKELIANVIHNLSDRKNKPFVRVNCAAIPDSLLESELFGVEEKIATGVTFREGKFRQADGGTIFLDEIGDMNLATQAKVLRVLQEREFERVGGSKTIKVDIRVISATNKDLDELREEKNFRSDLYYRLNTVMIPLPALKDRKEDIPFLIQHFLEKYSEENHKPRIDIAPPVVQALCNYKWPGNVRELMNVIERGVIFAEKGKFDYDQLPPQFSKELLSPSMLRSFGKLRHAVAKFEKKIIEDALQQANWNQTQAAKILDIPLSTLTRKIQRYRIRKPKIL